MGLIRTAPSTLPSDELLLLSNVCRLDVALLNSPFVV